MQGLTLLARAQTIQSIDNSHRSCHHHPGVGSMAGIQRSITPQANGDFTDRINSFGNRLHGELDQVDGHISETIESTAHRINRTSTHC